MTTQDDIRDEVLSVLTTIAPEVEADDIRDDVLLRDQVDLDSMDWLNFLIGIHKRLHVDIPESDYASLRTLTDVVRYVQRQASMAVECKPLLPCSDGVRGRPFRDHRQVIEGIIYRYRCGVPWRDLPADIGPWQTVWKRHRGFATDSTGTWC